MGHLDSEEKDTNVFKKSHIEVKSNLSDKLKAFLSRRTRKRLGLKQNDFSLKKLLIWGAVAFFGMFFAGVVVVTIAIAVLSIGLPDVHDIDKLFVPESTTIYDREGNILYVKHGDENRIYVPFEEISSYLVNATISIEDDEFWEHQGFDLGGITKAVLHEVFGAGSRRGGSTITQQYVKNAFLTNERSYTRKIKELILAVRLEKAYDKNKIIELYLNKIFYGNTAYGVQKAAEIYFNKDAKDLDIAESAILAALPQAPSSYNPYGSRRNTELVTPLAVLEEKGIYSADYLEKDKDYILGLIGSGYEMSNGEGIYIPGRADLVLRQMYKFGYITEDEKDEAFVKMQSIEFNDHKERIVAPHFVFYVVAELEEKYGKEVVEQGGLQVYTTIDPELQEIAEAAVVSGAERNTRAFNATNASLVAIDHKTGQIMAMVGSKDYYDEEIDGNVNIATSFRQPGSSFKPYIYAEAFYNRYYPASVIYDVKTQFGGGKPPENYDGRFRGPMTMRAALAQSRNIPAIKAYFLAGEQEAIIRRTQTMGIEFLDPDRDYGWPLALGTGEVRLLDHVGAFGVFANGGLKMEKTAILEVKNSKGESLEKFDENKRGEEVLDEQIAYLITSILSDTGVRLGPGMTIPGQVNAAKTGTSNKKVGTVNIPSNLLTLGYTYHITAGAWAGNSNDANSGNLYATANGYEAAAPIWKEFMVKAHNVKGWEYTEFPKPSGIITMTVSAATGKLPGAGTPPDGLRSDIFASFAIPSEVDNSFSKVNIDTRNNLLANNYCPEEFVEEKYFREHHAIVPTYENWESAVRAWAYGMASQDESQEVGAPPKETSPLCNKEHFESKRSVKITEPSNYTKVEPGKVEIKVKTKSDFAIEKVVFYLDDSVQYLATQAPFTGYIRISHFLEDDSKHTVRAVLYDKYGYTAHSTIEIRVQGGAESGEKVNTDPETDSSAIIEETPIEDPLPEEEIPLETIETPPENGGN